MEKKEIVIIGSSNTDMVVKTERFPQPGETILGGEFMMNPGGKGANQAVAAARMGGQVMLIAKTGNDIFGRKAVEAYQAEGIGTEYVFTDQEQSSGVALISVDASGENSILVAPGANGTLSVGDVRKARNRIENAGILLMQLEIPVETVQYAAAIASARGVKVVLNPAPAQELCPELLKCLYMIVPNETEAELLTGIRVHDWSSAREAADCLAAKGVDTVVITMGSKGAFIREGHQYQEVLAEKVKAVDTTAAGDTFCGTLCVGLSEGMSVPDAVRLACRAAAIAVTRPGAQASCPKRIELENQII